MNDLIWVHVSLSLLFCACVFSSFWHSRTKVYTHEYTFAMRFFSSVRRGFPVNLLKCSARTIARLVCTICTHAYCATEKCCLRRACFLYNVYHTSQGYFNLSKYYYCVQSAKLLAQQRISIERGQRQECSHAEKFVGYWSIIYFPPP